MTGQNGRTEHIRGWILWVGIVLLIAGCGGEEDAVDGPFVADWQLDERACDQSTTRSECFRLTIDVAGIAGERSASCRIYPLDTGGAELALDATVPDVDPESARHEVAIIGPFPIDLGDTPEFDVVLPLVDDDSFGRWQVTCDPGRPG
ncbi:MAG: hypothetical protein GY926_01305 [bacterium]|nr:hypothetical protein [bacterium]